MDAFPDVTQTYPVWPDFKPWRFFLRSISPVLCHFWLSKKHVVDISDTVDAMDTMGGVRKVKQSLRHIQIQATQP